jgi:hypothetical protein
MKTAQKIYSLPLIVPANTVVNTNTKLFFPAAPYLLKFKIDAIGFRVSHDPILSSSPLVTFVDGNNITKIENFPVFDLWNGQASNGAVTTIVNRTREFNLQGLTTQSCYITTSANFTSTTNLLLGYFYFYQN